MNKFVMFFVLMVAVASNAAPVEETKKEITEAEIKKSVALHAILDAYRAYSLPYYPTAYPATYPTTYPATYPATYPETYPATYPATYPGGYYDPLASRYLYDRFLV